MSTVFSGQPRWLSDNPQRAWGEKFFLVYIPIWVVLISLIELTFDSAGYGDVASILVGLVIGSPLFIVPALIAPRFGEAWYESYWFKGGVFIFIVNFSGNYFVTEYFFDVLGMIYHYPNLEITFDAALLGSGEQKVPLQMYLITQATYTTYHTTAIVLMRRVMTSGVPFKALVFAVLTAMLAYMWSYLETLMFANAALEGNFRYEDKEAMMKYGSIVFGMMFVPSFPIFYFLMEKRDRHWSLLAVVSAALAASWIGLFLTDLCAHAIL